MILVSLFRLMIIFEHWMHVKVYFALFLQNVISGINWQHIDRPILLVGSEHDYAKDHIEIVQFISVQAQLYWGHN